VQSLLSLQLTAIPDLHVPLWQESPCVHTSLSVHRVLSATWPCAHSFPLQASVVQMLPSSVQGVPAALKPSGGQVVPLHVSATSHSPCVPRQIVVAAAASVKSQLPLTHRSWVQTLPSLHAAHAAPALPHLAAVWLPRATHAPLSKHPVQHTPLWQLPPVHGVPSVTFTFEQAPFEQESVVHGFASLQLLQRPPFVPHAPTVVPVAQVPLLQQRLLPVQQFPPQHPPPVQAVPSATFVPPHCPLLHVSLVLHSTLQFTQKLPEPQALTVGVTQLDPLQHVPAPQHLHHSMPGSSCSR